jgi:hypothetical protein
MLSQIRAIEAKVKKYQKETNWAGSEHCKQQLLELYQLSGILEQLNLKISMWFQTLEIDAQYTDIFAMKERFVEKWNKTRATNLHLGVQALDVYTLVNLRMYPTVYEMFFCEH